MSIAGPWPDHLLTLDEWETWPKDAKYRYELAEGNLRIGPRLPEEHQMALSEVLFQLREQLPPELAPLHATEVVVFEDFPATIRIPDVAVVPRAVVRQGPDRLAARDVALAVEVIAPGSRRLDSMDKPGEYALAGIENYWIVDPERTELSVLELVGDQYKLIAKTSAALSVTAPAPLSVDVQALFQ